MSADPVAALGRDSDDALMRRVQRDDADAFGRLYDRYAAPAFAVAQSVCRNPSLAEDAVQEGFLAIWRGRASYRPKASSSFRGWVMKAVRNRAIDSLRWGLAAKRPQIVAAPEIEAADASSPSPHGLALERERSEALRRALGRLPEVQKDVIALGFFGGLTHFEIAEMLSLSHGTVKGRMRLGLEKLRNEVEVAELFEPWDTARPAGRPRRERAPLRR